MMRVHFLNVGHGDCTIIKHPSGRLSMIDINTSQDYDAESFRELMAEQVQKVSNPFSPYNPLLDALARLDALDKAKDELTDPIDFLQRVYPGERLWRFILTHPDLDHMRGLHRLYNTIGFTNFWDTDHTKEIKEYRSDDDKVDWNFIKSCVRIGFESAIIEAMRYLPLAQTS